MSKNIVVDFLVNKFGEYKIGWFSAYDTLKGMVALYGADKVQEALTEIVGENAQQSRALDAAKVCRVINHFYIEGVCSQCGSKEPPRK